MDLARYLLTTGVPFNNSANPEDYPVNIPGNAAAGVQATAEAEHNEEVKAYEIFQGVVQAMKDIILEAVDHEYLLEIKDEILGFLNKNPNRHGDPPPKSRRSIGFCRYKKIVSRERCRMGRK
jgi:hypothetical protein